MPDGAQFCRRRAPFTGGQRQLLDGVLNLPLDHGGVQVDVLLGAADLVLGGDLRWGSVRNIGAHGRSEVLVTFTPLPTLDSSSAAGRSGNQRWQRQILFNSNNSAVVPYLAPPQQVPVAEPVTLPESTPSSGNGNACCMSTSAASDHFSALFGHRPVLSPEGPRHSRPSACINPPQDTYRRGLLDESTCAIVAAASLALDPGGHF